MTTGQREDRRGLGASLGRLRRRTRGRSAASACAAGGPAAAADDEDLGGLALVESRGRGDAPVDPPTPPRHGARRRSPRASAGGRSRPGPHGSRESSAPANSTMNARISECSVQAAWVMSAGQRTASPAAIRVRSPATPTQPPPSMTMNQRRVRVGMRLDPGAAGEGELGDQAAGVAVDDLAGHAGRARRPSGRRWPTPKRRISMGIGRAGRASAAGAAPALLPPAAAPPDRGLGVGELLLA